jgi:hypothetical protein
MNRFDEAAKIYAAEFQQTRNFKPERYAWHISEDVLAELDVDKMIYAGRTTPFARPTTLYGIEIREERERENVLELWENVTYKEVEE